MHNVRKYSLTEQEVQLIRYTSNIKPNWYTCISACGLNNNDMKSGNQTNYSSGSGKLKMAASFRAGVDIIHINQLVDKTTCHSNGCTLV